MNKNYRIRCTKSVAQFGYVEGTCATDENGAVIEFATLLEAQAWMNENLFHHNVKTGERCRIITRR